MSPEGSVVVDQVWKRFRSDRHRNLLRDEVTRLVGHMRGTSQRGWRWAVEDVSFEVRKGGSLALVGANGSGKSTMLKMLVGVMFPTYGRISAAGRIGALIEVKAGIHPDLTGHENIYMFGSLLGLPRSEVRRRFDSIVEFAELEDAIDRQVKFYSSGMGMRLGFAVAAFLEPDVLVVDEVLAVGDATFQQKCLDRMRDVMAAGTTLLYVSHDLATVEAMCQEAVWLDHGQMRASGATRDVIGQYRRFVEDTAKVQHHVSSDLTLVVRRVTGVDGGPATSNAPTELELEITTRVTRTAKVVLGFTEGSASPVFLIEHVTHAEAGGTTLTCRIDQLPLAAGEYAVWATVLDDDGVTLLGWSPVGHTRVGGSPLVPAPTGVVRLSPIVVNSTWVAE